MRVVDAGNRWGNNGKEVAVPGCVCGPVPNPPANLPGTGAGLAGGGGRLCLCCRGGRSTPGSGSVKLPSKQPLRLPFECRMIRVSFHYACACSSSTSSTSHILCSGAPHCTLHPVKYQGGGVFAVEKHDTPGSLGWLADFGMVASTVCSRPEPIHAILPVGQGGHQHQWWLPY